MTSDEQPAEEVSQLYRLDQLCDGFEEAWRSGDSPRIEDYLTRVVEAERAALLRELLIVEISYRRQRGQQPAVGEYTARFQQIDRTWLDSALRTKPPPQHDPMNATVQQAPGEGLASTIVLPRIRYLGDYELLEEIARGGMGVVYKARQLPLNRIVAVKMILAGQLATTEDHDRFRSEAQAAALLDHPSIVPVFEVGEHEGRHYFSMGYVDGPSLSARLADGPLPPQDAAEIVAAVAEAVEYAHRQGVIHRDIKPSNVLIDRQGRPRVTDFGLAKRVYGGSDVTATGQILGTPSYMPPEQAAGQIKAVGPAADIYALGALLYAALTGRPPFQAATALETMHQVLEREPVAPRQLNPAVPRDLETIALKCLEKSVPRRYATAQALAGDLHRYLDGWPILARPVRRWEHVWRWCRRRPALAALIAAVHLLFAILMIGGPMAAVIMRRQRDETAQNLLRAEGAEAEANQNLANSLLAQARLTRLSHRPGQRFETLEAIRKARQIDGPSRKLADEAVAALCLADISVSRQWPGAPQGTHRVAFAPSLKVYARIDLEGNISVRRVESDVEIASFATGHRVCDYSGMEFSPDGRYLRATTYGETEHSCLFRLDVTPAAKIFDDDHIALAFSPDSQRFVARYMGNLFRVCELPVCKEVKRFTFPGATDDLPFIHWNPRKPQVVITRRTGWRIADLETGRQQAECPVKGGVAMVAWHPDGRHLAVGIEDPATIEIYDTETRQIAAPRFRMSRPGVVPTFNRAGDLLVGNDWSMMRRLWNPGSDVELLHLHAQDGNFFQFGPDDREAAVSIVGQDLQVFTITSGAKRRFRGPPVGAIDSSGFRERIAISRDGRILAGCTVRGLGLFDARSGFELATLPSALPIDFNASGALRSYGKQGIQEWPMEWNAQRDRIHVGRARSLYAGELHDWCSASRDSRIIAIPAYDRGAIVLHVNADIRKSTVGPQNDVRCTAVSPDGRWIATGSHESVQRLNNVQIWDITTGKLIKILPVSDLAIVQFSPRGRWLATISHTDSECRLWRTGDWQPGARFALYSRTTVAFSPDERIVALGGTPGKVELHVTESGQQFGTLSCYEDVQFIPQTFSPDGTRLYALADDSAVHWWDLARIRQELKELGLDQGWPDLPPPPQPPDASASPISVEIDTK